MFGLPVCAHSSADCSRGGAPTCVWPAGMLQTFGQGVAGLVIGRICHRYAKQSCQNKQAQRGQVSGGHVGCLSVLYWTCNARKQQEMHNTLSLRIMSRIARSCQQIAAKSKFPGNPWRAPSLSQSSAGKTCVSTSVYRKYNRQRLVETLDHGDGFVGPATKTLKLQLANPGHRTARADTSLRTTGAAAQCRAKTVCYHQQPLTAVV